MNLTEKTIKLSSTFPEIGIVSKSLEKTAKVFPELQPKRFASFSVLIAFIFLILTIILAVLLYSQAFAVAIAYGLVVFAMTFMFLIRIPEMDLNARENEMVHQLPFLLREIALLLELGLPFEKALRITSEKNSALGLEMKKTLASMDRGVTMQRAFLDFASGISSTNMKRAITQLVSIYESGKGSDGVKRIADDLISIEQNRFKQESSKNAIYGLIFVTVCAVVPTFVAILSLSSSALSGEGLEFSKSQIAIILFLLIPAIGFLLIVKSRAGGEYTAGETGMNNGDVYLFLAAVTLAAITIMTDNQMAIYSVMAMVFGLLLFIFHGQRTSDEKTESIERDLPDALLAISNLPQGMRVERIFESMKPYGELGKESEIALKQIKSNVKPEDAIVQLSRRNNSVLLDQTCTSLVTAINTGKLDRLSSIAEYIMKVLEIKRERSSLLSMQKYTIYLGAVITPLVIRMALSLVSSFQKTMGNVTGAGIETMMPAYIIIYSMISSYYLSSIEEKKSRKMINFIVMAIVGLAILFIMK